MWLNKFELYTVLQCPIYRYLNTTSFAMKIGKIQEAKLKMGKISMQQEWYLSAIPS